MIVKASNIHYVYTMIISHITKVLILFVLASTSFILNGQSVVITLKSQINKDKAGYSSQLSEHLKEYEVVQINLEDKMVTQLQGSNEGTILLDLGDKTIIYDKFDLHYSGSNSKKGNVITLSSQNNENLTINKNFINGIYREGREVFAIQPLRDFIKGADKNLFITYRALDIINTEDHICTINEVRSRGKSINRKMAASPCERIRLAIANDFSMYQKYGNSDGVINHNTAVINNIRSLYRSDFSSVVEFEIVNFFIPTTAAEDPFTSNPDAQVLLSDFTNWGQANGNPWDNIDYDMGELWTARDITYQGNSGTAGLADTPLSTNPYARVFHILEDFTSTAISLTNLTAHEMGHNFSSQHDAGAGFIMSPTVPNSTAGWSAQSIASIDLRLSTIGGDLLNCSCGEVITGPSLLCNGDSDNFSISISEGVGPYTITYNDGVSQFIINNYSSGDLISISPTMTTTYTIETIEDVGIGGLDFTCGSNTSITVNVFDEAGIASANGQQGSYEISDCDASVAVPLTTGISMLNQDQVIGWWITEDQPITGSLTNINLQTTLASAEIGVPLSNPANHIYESTNGSPLKNYALNMDCSSLDDTKTYFATPFVSNKKDEVTDVQCTINGTSLSGNFTFNGFPASLVKFNSVDICRPQNPINDPVYSYTIVINGYNGNVANHYFYLYSPEGEGWFQLNGNGTLTFPQSTFNQLNDPGLENVDIWVWEEGGNGMANATSFITLDITYPGAPAIVFPNVTDVNSCSFGTPVALTCDCTLPPCTSTASIINSTNVNDGTLVTSANQLSTSGITDVTTGTSIWQAQIEIILNEDFSVGGGSTLCIDIGPCEEP